MNIKVGCCGFPSGMQNYFKKFSLVEVQLTFYSPPKLETIKKWRAKAPRRFEFSLKAWQVITHPASSPTYRKAKLKIPENRKSCYGFFAQSDEVFSAWERTKEQAKALEAKVVIFQTPASFAQEKKNLENLEVFFSSVERGSLKFAWEARGKWEASVIKRLCSELDLIHCVDPLASKPALEQSVAYFRLHGLGERMYAYRYTQRDLAGLLRICKKSGAEEIYCLFNNVHMLQDAARFEEMCKYARKKIGYAEGIYKNED